MERKMNQEIRNYRAAMFMGLSLRQCVCSALAIGVSVWIYMTFQHTLSQDVISWLCKPLTAPVTAAEIVPYFNNVVSADVQGYISSAGVLTLDYYCAGRSGITEKIVIRTYIEKKVAGLFWSRVDIGGSNNEWVFVSTSSSYSTDKSITLPSKGTYRINVTFTVSGSGGDADTIQRTLEKTY